MNSFACVHVTLSFRTYIDCWILEMVSLDMSSLAASYLHKNQFFILPSLSYNYSLIHHVGVTS